MRQQQGPDLGESGIIPCNAKPAQLGLDPGSVAYQLCCPELRSPLPAPGYPRFTAWGPRQCHLSQAGHSPVMRTSAERQAKAGTSTTKLCRDREKARMLSIQSPKPRAHCSRCSTRPEQKMSFPSAGLDLVGRDTGGGQGSSRAGWQGGRAGVEQTAGGSPVGQTENEELQEGRLQQQVLVTGGQLGKAGNLLSPLADNLQGTREQVIELLHIPGVLLPEVGQHQLLELEGSPAGSDPRKSPAPRPPRTAMSRPWMPDPGGESRAEIPPTLACQLWHINPGLRLLEGAYFSNWPPPKGAQFSSWSAGTALLRICGPGGWGAHLTWRKARPGERAGLTWE